MQVVCKKKSALGTDFGKRDRTYTYEELELEKEYIVMGVEALKENNVLYYLLDSSDGNASPFWYPYSLFEVSDNSVPKNWHINFYNKEGLGDIFYVAGYPELCNKQDYHDDLLEREYDAMLIYFKRKIEYENELRLEKLWRV